MELEFHIEYNREVLIRNFIRSLREVWDTAQSDNGSGTKEERELALKAINILVANGYIDSQTYLDTEKVG